MSVQEQEVREQDRFLPIANISRIMKRALPPNAKVAKEAKETVQECVSEFISFITSEGCHRLREPSSPVLDTRFPISPSSPPSSPPFLAAAASDKCQREKRKTINGDDLLWAMTTLGFDDYVEPLKVYLHKFREIEV